MYARRNMSITLHFLTDQPHHVQELARLHEAEWGHLFPKIPLETRVDRLRAAAGRSEIPSLVIAVDGPTLVGSSALIAQDMDDRPELTPWLAAVYVKASYRRQGIATALATRIEEEAAALGVAKIYLYTEHEEAFYAKRGWEPMEHRDYHGTPVAVMFKLLAGGKPEG